MTDRDRVTHKRRRADRQLLLWVRGRSVHDWAQDRCVPDYSCCRPELAAPLEEREHYAALLAAGDLWPAVRLRLLFLKRAVASRVLVAK